MSSTYLVFTCHKCQKSLQLYQKSEVDVTLVGSLLKEKNQKTIRTVGILLVCQQNIRHFHHWLDEIVMHRVACDGSVEFGGQGFLD